MWIWNPTWHQVDVYTRSLNNWTLPVLTGDRYRSLFRRNTSSDSPCTRYMFVRFSIWHAENGHRCSITGHPSYPGRCFMNFNISPSADHSCGRRASLYDGSRKYLNFYHRKLLCTYRTYRIVGLVLNLFQIWIINSIPTLCDNAIKQGVVFNPVICQVVQLFRSVEFLTFASWNVNSKRFETYSTINKTGQYYIKHYEISI